MQEQNRVIYHQANKNEPLNDVQYYLVPLMNIIES